MKSFKIIIHGGRTLSGPVKISGAKNAALPCLASAILSEFPSRLRNVPRVEDIRNLLLAMGEIGAQYEIKENEVEVLVASISSPVVSREIASATRASVLLLGPMVARHGYAKIAFPGGCSIGDRKINFHLDGLARMGVAIEIQDDFIVARVKKLKGIEYRFPSKTVTGTENLMMAAVLAEGETIFDNCALEPEVTDLAQSLVEMGADIRGIGQERMVITGKSSLKGTSHRIIPDRIEAGTYLIAGCFKGNHIKVESCIPEHLLSLHRILTAIGFSIECGENWMLCKEGGSLRPISIQTEPYPGFPTDLQAQLTTLLTQIKGESRVAERIFNDRFKHIHELNRLGAAIEIKEDTAFIRGGTQLSGTQIKTTDLRASAALVLGGLIAEGQTVIDNASQLVRGYESMTDKLQKMGADIKIIE